MICEHPFIVLSVLGAALWIVGFMSAREFYLHKIQYLETLLHGEPEQAHEETKAPWI